MAGAVAAGLWLVSVRLGLIATVAAVLMAFTRVYIGAHYPWDVIAGVAVGATVTVLGWLLLARTLTGLTGWLRMRPGIRNVFSEADEVASGYRSRGSMPFRGSHTVGGDPDTFTSL